MTVQELADYLSMAPPEVLEMEILIRGDYEEFVLSNKPHTEHVLGRDMLVID